MPRRQEIAPNGQTVEIVSTKHGGELKLVSRPDGAVGISLPANVGTATDTVDGEELRYAVHDTIHRGQTADTATPRTAVVSGAGKLSDTAEKVLERGDPDAEEKPAESTATITAGEPIQADDEREEHVTRPGSEAL